MTDYEKLPYGAFEDDSRGFRHSIDKCVVDYRLKSGCAFSDFLDFFCNSTSFVFVSDRGEEGYNSYFDKPPCSAYSWFQSAFWFPHCHVRLGFFYHDDYKNNRHEFKVKDLIRVEFNPNKVFQDFVFVSLIKTIKRFCQIGLLLEVDYSVDVPVSPDRIITQSRKSRIIYNDSRYYGKRHSHGRLKVYNKKKEVKDKEKLELEGDLTRCEVTFLFSQDIEFFSCFLSFNPDSSVKLSKNLRSIADLINLCSSYGEDREELLNRFVPDKRNRDMLLPVLFGEKVVVFDIVRFYKLLFFYSDLYHFGFSFSGPLGQSHNLLTFNERS